MVKLRPQLKKGDVVKLSKKGRACLREFPLDSTLVVSDLDGDGIDRSSVVTCRAQLPAGYRYFVFYRSELWATGQNAFR